MAGRNWVILQLEINILVALIFFSFGASALTMDETIKVNGEGNMNGELSAFTNIGDAHDLVLGSGTQEYHRNFDFKDNKSMLQSDYSLINAAPESLYKYKIWMNNPLRKVQHTVSLGGRFDKNVPGSIISKSTIQSTDRDITTNYDIRANGSSLFERISDWSQAHRMEIASTSIKGSFSLESKLRESMNYYLSDYEWLTGKVVVEAADKGKNGVFEPVVVGTSLENKDSIPGDQSSSNQDATDCSQYSGSQYYDCIFGKSTNSTNNTGSG